MLGASDDDRITRFELGVAASARAGTMATPINATSVSVAASIVSRLG
jgi:hypothetical protein